MRRALTCLPGNYVAVHAYGQACLVPDSEEVLAHLNESVDFFDPDLRRDSPGSVEEGYLRKMVPGVVAFRLRVDRLEAKAKLNQNKREIDRLAVRTKLLESAAPEEREMGGLM